MDNSNHLHERFMTVEGFEFDFESIAIAITSTDGSSISAEHKQSMIDSFLVHYHVEESSQNVTLALIRYFLLTRRPLLPEMMDILSGGITEHLKGGKPWGRPNIKGKTDFYQLALVWAIDRKFPHHRHEIGAELDVSAGAIKKQIEAARKSYAATLWADRLVLFLPDNFVETLPLLDNLELRDQFITRSGATII